MRICNIATRPYLAVKESTTLNNSLSPRSIRFQAAIQREDSLADSAHLDLPMCLVILHAIGEPSACFVVRHEAEGSNLGFSRLSSPRFCLLS